MATPKPAPKNGMELPLDSPDPDMERDDTANTYGLEFSEMTGEYYDPRFEDADGNPTDPETYTDGLLTVNIGLE